MRKYQLLISIVILAVVAGCDWPGRKDIEVLDIGLVSANGQEIIFAENTDIDSSLWLVAGDRAGEAFGSLISRTGDSTQAAIAGAAYVTPQGEGFTVTLNDKGYPGTITYTDGSVMSLTNYSSTTVDVQYIPSGGSVLPIQTIDLDQSFFELQALINENGLIFDTAGSQSAENKTLRSIRSADYTSDARTRRTVIKITSTALSVAGCVGSLFICEVAPPVAVIACTSAYAGLVSTVEYISDSNVFEGDDVSGGVSFMLSAAACVGLSIPDCASALLSIVDAAIEDCIAAQDQFVKRCYNDNVYWFNDCGVRSEPADECPCGCENGACIPISLCASPLAITVSAQASPACASVGENIFFSSTMSGGDSASYVYTWDFGDGGTGVLDAVSHSYATSGRKTVSLTVSDSQGNYGFAAIPVQVENCEQFLEAAITSAPDCTARFKPVDFGSRVRGGDGNYSYFWAFGDGASSTDANPSHSYSKDGLYMVTLTVTDGLENRCHDAFGIEVGNCSSPVTVTVSADKTCFEVGETVYLSAGITGSNALGASYLWDFGDGHSDTGSYVVSHVYNTTGSYTVTATVTDSAGNTGTGALSIQVGNCSTTTLPDLSPYACVDLDVYIVTYCGETPTAPAAYTSTAGHWGDDDLECPPVGYGSYDDGLFTGSWQTTYFGLKKTYDVSVRFIESNGDLFVDTLSAKNNVTCTNIDDGCFGFFSQDHDITASNIPCIEFYDHIVCEIVGGDVAGHIDSYSKKGSYIWMDENYTNECSSAYNDYTLAHPTLHDSEPSIRLYMWTAD